MPDADHPVTGGVAAGLLACAAGHQALCPGLILIGDKRFAGQDFENLVTGKSGLHLVRPSAKLPEGPVLLGGA